MQKHPALFRLTAAAAVASLLAGQSAPAFAQQAENTTTAGDPPGRVGRVAQLTGDVSFHTADEDHWEPATVNYPVTTGNAFWTQPQASADLGVGGTRATLNQSTELDIETLDDLHFIATAPQGEVYLRITDLVPGEVDTIRTPRGEISFTAPGRYSIAAGDTATPTVVTVDSGAATITGPGVTLNVGAHQTATITGADTFVGAIGAEAPDAFLTAQIARDQPVVVANRIAPPPAVAQMTGYEAVADTGTWTPTPDYGQVWYPPVDPDWVPYRHGHWGYVAPWGWTWIDDASWGFAPFHYGRWVEIQNRWAWTPVVPGVAVGIGYERPVYAPALVSFVGLAAGVAIGVGIGASVGWIPLGPREVYRPPYHVSNTYIRNINVTNVTNVTNITNVTNNRTFVNQRVATFVPQSAMQRSQGVAALARPVPAAQLASLRPLNQVPVQPTMATRGITPAVAQSLHIAPAAGAPVAPRVAPGPAVASRTGNAPLPLAPRGGRPVLPAGAPQAAARPAAPVTASPAPPRAPGLPALAPQGGAPRPMQPGGAPGPAITPRSAAPRPNAEGPRVPVPGAPVPAGTAPAAAAQRPVEPAQTRPVAPQSVPQPAHPVAPVTPVPHPAASAPQVARPVPTAPAPRPAAAAPAPHPAASVAAPAPRPATPAPVPRPAPPAPRPAAPEPRPTAPEPRPAEARPAQAAPRPAPPAPHPAPAHKTCPPNERTC